MTYDVNAIFETLKLINAKTFTIANCARACAINEKIARRRLRANASRDKNDQMKTSKFVDATSRANVKYEYALTMKNVETMIDVIK